MACNDLWENELHSYLNHDLNQEKEIKLKDHLSSCTSCQTHLRELKKVDHQLLQLGEESVGVPSDFKQNIMNHLPKDSKTKRFSKVLKEHPLISAAVVFFIMVFVSSVTQYHSNQHQMSLSKHEGVITEGDRVIIPEDKIIHGDFIVRNAKVILEGKIRGNLTLVNSEVVNGHHSDSTYNILSHHVEGKVVKVDRYFAWMYHKIEYEFKNFLSFVTP